jgi:hypothetical protein
MPSAVSQDAVTDKLRNYWALIRSFRTLLLLATGVAG